MKITQKEAKQVSLFEKLIRKEITQKIVAELLGCTVRTVKRRQKRYAASGIEGLIHRRRGQPGNRAKDPNLRADIMAAVRSKYEGWPPTHIAQMLAEQEQITILPKTLRLWMLSDGLWEKERKRKPGRRWRQRKEHFGQMVQMDGSKHLWIGNEYWALMKLVDDATGRVFMRFYASESYASVVDLNIRYFKKFGIPASIYTDRGSVYKVNTNNPDDILITHYERGLGNLGVELIHARSPQAKGRVERSFNTDQKRLVRELKLIGITTIEAANDYLEQVYIPKHNERYAIPPVSNIDLHKPINGICLERIFVQTSQRHVLNDWTISYQKRLLQLDNTRPAIVKPRDVVTVNEMLNGTIFITIRKEQIGFKEIAVAPQKQSKKKVLNAFLFDTKQDVKINNCDPEVTYVAKVTFSNVIRR